MKEQALSLVRGVDDPSFALNLLREYLQAQTLQILSACEAFNALAFVGGTALRFLHGLPRFSEDLDFSLEDKSLYHGREWLEQVKRELTLAGYKVAVTWQGSKVVHSSWIRVAGLLHECGFSAFPEQNLSIKVEIDTRPPAGANCKKQVVSKYGSYLLQFYDLPSLMAGKLHALLRRQYCKGRDWYDLLWYLSQRPPIEPNLTLLQNALEQTAKGAKPQAENWREVLIEMLLSFDFAEIRSDVLPFLENYSEAKLLTAENLTTLLRT